MTLAASDDAFGRVLLAHLEGRSAVTMVERDDGFVESESPRFYFAGVRRWPAVERRALRYVRGRVLDVGTGAGRVALELQRRGRDVVGLDYSQLAARVARKRGVTNVRVGDLEALPSSLGRFDTVVMFGNNLGLLSNATKAKRILRALHATTTDRGRIVGSNNDPYANNGAARHRDYHRRNRTRGRLPGQVRLRLRYRESTTPWVDWLFLSTRELEKLLEGTGWRLERVIREPNDSQYTVVIEKEPPGG